MLLLIASLVFLDVVSCTREYPRNHEPEASPIAISPLGKYKGSIMKNSNDEPIFAFKGIRYAEPPVGELRFKPAVPVKEHEGVEDATKEPPICPQPPLGEEPMSEDCLFLNIYTKELPSGNEKLKKPVFVIIHTGLFESLGSRSDFIGPQYLLNRDVVMVTFNYRLGALGFISTGDEHAPGNLGMKDQVEVLKWIQKNIEAFGGDPKSVTIYGNGSGGSCVNLHLVSPLSKGLFHRAVMSSGTVTGNYPIGKSLQQLTKKQARLFGCPDDSSKKIIDCLKAIPADELGNSLTKLRTERRDGVIWQPVIEGNFGQERFLTDHPVKLIIEGKFEEVPTDIGYNSDSFSDYAINLVKDNQRLEKLDREWCKEAPKLFWYDHNAKRDIVSKDLRSFYFKDKKIDKSSLPQLIEIFNDALVGFEINRAVKLLSAKSKKSVYLYYFTSRGKYSFFSPKEGPVPDGPVLYDDLIYMFPITKKFPLIKKGDPDFDEINRISVVIENFAKTGTPILPSEKESLKWEPYNLKTQKYLLSGEKIQLKERLLEKRFAEWEKLIPLNEYTIVEDASL